VESGSKWFWAIRLKGGPDHLIGAIDLSLGPDENRGFWLSPEWQGRGLMSEACEAVTEFWFNALGQEFLRVSKAVSNLASHRISEREGARLVAVEERDYVSGRAPAEIWELARQEWNGARGLR
jgi:[ribosomal protein S5]-alanine N-acetyltransferase